MKTPKNTDSLSVSVIQSYIILVFGKIITNAYNALIYIGLF